MEENLQGTFEIEGVQQNKLGRGTENLKGKEIYWQVCSLCLQATYRGFVKFLTKT